MRFSIFLILSFATLTAQANIPIIEKVEWVLGEEGVHPDVLNPFDSVKSSVPFRSSYWVKVNFSVPREDDYVLSGGNLYIRDLQFYDGYFQWLSSGNYHEMHLKEGSYTIFIFYPFGDYQNKYLVSLKLIKSSLFFKGKLAQEVNHRVFLAVLLFLFLLSMAFFFIRKATDWLYFHYALYLFSIIYFFSYQYGILGSFWPIFNQVSPYLIWVSSVSLTLSYIYFAQTFLDLRKTDPLVFKIIQFGKYFILLVVIADLLGFIFGYDVQHNFVYKAIIVLVQITLIPIILYRIYKLKTTLSWILFFGALILGFATISGQVASVIKATDETNLYIQIALLLEVFIFSVGIGIRIWIIEEEKRKTQLSLLKQMEQNVAIQQEYTFELETKVKERTVDLFNKNEEKDLLLKEIHHRVKNNLQTIASLLSIQLRRLKSEPAKLAIEDSMNRVKVMGLIHKFLYQKDSFSSIDLNEYINQLLNMLIDASNVPKKITQHVEIDSIKIDIDRAINIGLILNELVTNSIKHAFLHLDDPILILKIHHIGDEVFLIFSDNGSLKDIDVLSNSKGFGWKLINSLVGGLEGEIEYESKEGFEVKIKFPYNSPD
ncbi:MAG: hypothetical protein L3J29_02580 [Cyclobacteriaceae bacterium]|nr:hypothetical protein [Cyclobacteriaceae bacterium]